MNQEGPVEPLEAEAQVPPEPQGETTHFDVPDSWVEIIAQVPFNIAAGLTKKKKYLLKKSELGIIKKALQPVADKYINEILPEWLKKYPLETQLFLVMAGLLGSKMLDKDKTPLDTGKDQAGGVTPESVPASTGRTQRTAALVPGSDPTDPKNIKQFE